VYIIFINAVGDCSTAYRRTAIPIAFVDFTIGIAGLFPANEKLVFESQHRKALS
jgi:hypothetical protein